MGVTGRQNIFGWGVNHAPAGLATGDETEDQGE
jgi:hypothetical protein